MFMSIYFSLFLALAVAVPAASGLVIVDQFTFNDVAEVYVMRSDQWLLCRTHAVVVGVKALTPMFVDTVKVRFEFVEGLATRVYVRTRALDASLELGPGDEAEWTFTARYCPRAREDPLVFMTLWVYNNVSSPIVLRYAIGRVLPKTVEDLLRENAELARAVDRLEAELKELKREYAELERKYVALLASYSELRGNYTSLTEAHAELSRRYADLRDRYEELLTERAEIEERARSLVRDLESMEARYGELLIRFSQYNATVAAEMENLRGIITMLRANNTALLDRLREVERGYAELYESYRRLLNNYTELRLAYSAEKARLTSTIEGLQTRLRETEAERRSLMARMEMLMGDLSFLRTLSVVLAVVASLMVTIYVLYKRGIVIGVGQRGEEAGGKDDPPEEKARGDDDPKYAS